MPRMAQLSSKCCPLAQFNLELSFARCKNAVCAVVCG